MEEHIGTIQKIIIISVIVYAIYYTMLPGEIFGKLGEWFERNLPHQIHKPVFACAICMAFWYGSGIYWLVWHKHWVEWLICAIGAVGFNALILRLAPERDDDD